MRVSLIILMILATCVLSLFGQSQDSPKLSTSSISSDELAVFYAETKQVNQFFRRFNGEEDVKGVRLPISDPLYRSTELRRKYLNMLFDQNSPNITPQLREAFINDVLKPSSPKYLDFHGGEWFGEATVMFQRGRERVNYILYLKLVKENLGSKWVIQDVYHPAYDRLYVKDDQAPSRFLHPMSHEIDFMNLERVFRSGLQTADYFRQGYEVDRLSIFLYDLINIPMNFIQVTDLKFHFFQIDGWYIEISEINRPGYNRGWLITNLIRLEDGQKDRLIRFIYRKN